ncbi:hypothetical protein GCM10028805_00800 [Spirosoma harenae]
MPKFSCKCSHIIPIGEIPTPDQWNMISDIEYDSFAGSIDSEQLYSKMKVVLKCPVCGRLYVFWNGWQADPTCYEKSLD